MIADMELLEDIPVFEDIGLFEDIEPLDSDGSSYNVGSLEAVMLLGNPALLGDV